MGYIYRITNTIDGKRYIGQSKCKDIETRWKQHKKVDRNLIGPYLYNSYIRHGIDAFIFEIICICFDEDCDKYEKEYILKYNTLSPNGYNLRLGPTLSKHTEISKETIRQKMKERYKNDEVMRKNLCYRRTGEHTTEEHKRKLRESQLRYWKNMSSEEYDKVCKKRKDMYENHVRNRLTDTQLTGLEKGRKASQKKVGKYDLNDNLIEEYPSVVNAAETLGLHHATIRKVCRGQKHYNTAGGFKWKFI